MAIEVNRPPKLRIQSTLQHACRRVLPVLTRVKEFFFSSPTYSYYDDNAPLTRVRGKAALRPTEEIPTDSKVAYRPEGKPDFPDNGRR